MSIMPSDPLQVLIVEDDPSQAQLLTTFLAARNHQITCVHAAKPALEVQQQPDFILLDLNLPDIEGIRLCPMLRDRFPAAFIIMLTARQEEIDRIIGLESGADDYITKPYSLREVDARMRAIQRRHQRDASQARTPHVGLRLTPSRCRAVYDGREVEFTAQEFRVLEVMVSSPKRIWTRHQLIQQAWEEGLYITDRVVDAMVARIRKKLRSAFQQEFLFTKHGMGYGYDPDT